jgi:glycosyltransferase involved in cell wall biosynthesis
MVLFEAVACGTPTSAPNIGGILTLLENERDGLVVGAHEKDDIVAALRRLKTKPQFAAALRAVKRLSTKRQDRHSGWNDPSRSEPNQNALRPVLVQVAGYYSPHLGGMERVAKAAAEGLAARGNNVLVLTSGGGGSADETDQTSGLTVKRLPSRDLAHTPITPALFGELRRLPEGAIVHLHLGQAFYPELVWLASRIRRFPYVVHFHLDIGPSGPLGTVFLAYKATVLRGVIRGAARIVVFSEEQRSFIHERYRVGLDRIVIIPNGVAPEFFLPSHEQRVPHNLLFVGRLSVQKRADRLLAAVALMTHQVQLTIVGAGEDEAALHRQAADLKLKNVTYAGVLTGPALLEQYASADIFVMTSEREGMPLVALEAMAAGLPIVGTNVTGIRELISGVGILVDDPVPEQLAAALDELLDHPESVVELGRLSAAKAAEFSWSELLVKFEQLYDDIASEVAADLT